MLWVWETPTDLRGFRRPDTGVAFLSATIESRDGSLQVRMRRAKLLLPAQGLIAMPVIRIHEFDDTSALDIPGAHERIRAIAKKVLRDFGTSRIQFDFDAKERELGSYARLLEEIRGSECPTHGCFLSITAIASRCLPGDRGFPSVPVNEIVPMAFALGPLVNRRETAAALGAESSRCRGSIGVWKDEVAHIVDDRRTYVFTSGQWTVKTAEELWKSR